uniref:Zinc finger protein ZXDC n=2 Tax=Culex pipiens TaxID=7175 RepID=A0A8D8F866_CULPI
MNTHTGERPFHCQNANCNATFESPRGLSKHKRRKHMRERYECTICGKLSRSLYELNYHNNTHTGEKPFKCANANCDAQFAHPSGLQKHKNRCQASCLVIIDQ